MNKEDLIRLKKKISELSELDKKHRDLYLRKIALGEIQGPSTGYASIDKPWLKYYNEDKLMEKLTNKSIYQFAYDSNKNNLDNVAIDLRSSSVDFKFGIKVTYKEFFDKVKKIAKACHHIGVKEDEIIPLILPNIPEARYLIYGINYIGATSYPISPLLPANQLELLLSQNSVKTIFVFEMFYEKYKEVLENSSVEHIVYLDGTESLPFIMKVSKKIMDAHKEKKTKSELNHTETLNSEKMQYNIDRTMKWDKFYEFHKKCNEDIQPIYKNDHIAAIIGTSGTTGVPKGVCLTDKNINSVAFSYKNGEYFVGNFMDALIPSIGYGISMIHYQTVDGRYVYLIPELLTTKFAEAVSVLKPDNFPGGPVHYINLLNSKEYESGKVPKPENWISGGATLPKIVEKSLNNVDEGYKETKINENLIVRQGYGLSENTAMGTYCKRGAYAFGSIGIPIIYENVGVFVPNTDEELIYGEQGELCINGDSVMKEYLNNEQETEKVIKIHSDGKRWIHTKDIVYIDEDGHIFHVDRIKNIFMRYGFNVHPSKISEFLNTIPFIKNSVVIGFEHPKEQSVPVAFIELDKNKTNNKDWEELRLELQQACFKNLEETSVPFDYVLVDELPINVGGKIDLQLIKEKSGIDLYKSTEVPCKKLVFTK